MRTEYAVIGAGPAGATLAALLARSGRSTVLVDRDTFPRDKVCGEFLSWDAEPLLELLGVTDEIRAAGCPGIDHCRLVGDHGAAEFELPGTAMGISRHMLDALLVTTARNAGAVVLEGHNAVGIERQRDPAEVRLQRRSDAEAVELQARHVVAAWGRWGRLDQELERSFVQAPRRHFGFKQHAASNGYPREANVIELHSFRGGYLGVSSIEEGLTNLCGLAAAERMEGTRGGWDDVVLRLRRERRSLDEVWSAHEPVERFLSSDPVIFAGKENRVGSWPCIGDASGMIDPLTGNGMAMAIQSGALAFISLLESGGRDWPQRWSALFADRLRWSRRSAALLTRPRVFDTSVRAGLGRAVGRFLSERTRISVDDARRLAETAGKRLSS